MSALAALLFGCAGPSGGLPPPQPPGSAPRTPRPAVLINDEPVAWEQLHAPLAEAAGGTVLEELVLDRLVAQEYRSQLNKSPEDVTNETIADERQYLTDTIRRSGASRDQAVTLVDDLRKTRGLGNARFTGLLRRNAMMRELVAPNVTIDPDIVRQRFEVRFGVRYRARILTTATEADAANALHQLRAGQVQTWLDALWTLRLSPEAREELVRANTTAHFAALAAKVSTDESKGRGGEIEPISPADPAYSPALRAALVQLEPGHVSGVLALDPGFGIALLEETLPAAQTTLEEQRADIEDELRRRQERLLMDTLARRLLQSARVVVMDPSLGWSWKNRRTEPQP